MDSTPYSPIATGFGEDDDIVEFEENMFSTTDVPEQRPRAEESEREKWESQRFSSKFRVVMLDLKDSVRWDDSYGSPSTPVIEDYKKEALLTGSERGDNTNPTFFQMLARYTDEFAYLSAGARRAVIRTIVAFKEKEKAARGTSEEEVSGQPALNLAVKFDNDEFIDCVMECWPSGFSELIDMQDNEGENCLHLVFALPDLGRATKAGIKAARDAALSRGQKIIPKARAESLAAVDRDGNTPIHHAMHYLMCSNRGEDYINLVKTMIIKGDKIMMANRGPINRRKESPLLYCSRTLKVIRDAKQRAEVAASQRSAAARQAPNPKDNVNGARDQRDTKPRNTEEGQDGKMMMAANRGRPMQQPGVDKISVLLRGGQERPMGSAETSNLYRGTAINRPGSPAASVGKPESYPGKGAETRPQVAQPPNQSAGKTPAPAADESKSSARILIDFLTRHYIRTRTDFDARNLIYGVNSSDKNLCIDASGYSKAEEIIRLVDRMAYGGFSEILSYACLPTVAQIKPSEAEAKPVKKSYAMNHGMSVNRTAKENPNPGRTALVAVFERMYAAGVKHILTLQVEDRELPSHTDAAIETALQGRDSMTVSQKSRPITVEIWDWRKPDLSVEVVAFAAPDVIELNLYWSGNQAILRAWSCPEGIPRLKKLKRVILHAAPGLETTDRMNRMINRFETDIKREAAKEDRDIALMKVLKIQGHLIGSDLSKGGGDWVAGRVQGEKQHDWIDRMEGFRNALRSIHEEFSKKNIEDPERVRVALIDDGVDLNRLDVYHVRKYDAAAEAVDYDVVMTRGLTYCLPEGGSQSPWTSSSGGHGTIMANMILRINPWAFLYSMKLQDRVENDGRRTIFAESAASALQGAISRDVTLVSMSWSVRNKLTTVTNTGAPSPSANPADSETRSMKPAVVETSPITLLEEAVTAAVQQNIIMFCSATDDIQVGGMDFLPYQKAPKYIFRIGAATALGTRDPYAEDEKTIDYFFPGNQVAEPWNPKAEGKVIYHDGSSVSTALATGLASLIIYCAILVRTYYKYTMPTTSVQYETFQRYVELLKKRDNMKRAFDCIDSDYWDDRKFLPVWEVFGNATKEIEDTKDLKDKIGALEKLVRRLCIKLR